MSINVAKTKMMIISSKQNVNRIPKSLPSIELNYEKINYSSHEKLLGITIDKTLAWEKQVDVVLKNCNSLLYVYSITYQIIPFNFYEKIIF